LQDKADALSVTELKELLEECLQGRKWQIFPCSVYEGITILIEKVKITFFQVNSLLEGLDWLADAVAG